MTKRRNECDAVKQQLVALPDLFKDGAKGRAKRKVVEKKVSYVIKYLYP